MWNCIYYIITRVSIWQMTDHKVLPFIEINIHYHTPPVWSLGELQSCWQSQAREKEEGWYSSQTHKAASGMTTMGGKGWPLGGRKMFCDLSYRQDKGALEGLKKIKRRSSKGLDRGKDVTKNRHYAYIQQEEEIFLFEKFRFTIKLKFE